GSGRRSLGVAPGVGGGSGWAVGRDGGAGLLRPADAAAGGPDGDGAMSRGRQASLGAGAVLSNFSGGQLTRFDTQGLGDVVFYDQPFLPSSLRQAEAASPRVGLPLAVSPQRCLGGGVAVGRRTMTKAQPAGGRRDRKSTRLNSSHVK